MSFSQDFLFYVYLEDRFQEVENALVSRCVCEAKVEAVAGFVDNVGLEGLGFLEVWSREF